MYQTDFFVDCTASIQQEFKTMGAERVRLKQTSLSDGDGPDQRYCFIAKSRKPFLIVVTTKAKGADVHLDGQIIIIIVAHEGKNGRTTGIALVNGLRNLHMETLATTGLLEDDVMEIL